VSSNPASEANPAPTAAEVPGRSVASKRPAKSNPSGPTDYYREWVKGNSVANLVKHKLSAAQEARRLKHQKTQEDERRALIFLRRMNGDERDDYFDSLGSSDPVYGKLRNTSHDDEDMHEVL
jgi:hypothetical protein